MTEVETETASRSGREHARSEAIQSRSPVTGRLLESFPVTGPAAVADEVEGARQVQPLWALLRLADRARYVRRMAQAVIDDMEEIVDALAAEGGRPRAEVAVLEVLPAIDALLWIGGVGARALAGKRIPVSRSISPLKRAAVEREPIGVIAVVGSGSAPFAQPLAQIAGALLAGNAAVFKGAPRACLAASRIARVIQRASVPEGLVRVINGDERTARALARSSAEKLLFTGSEPAATHLAAERALQRREIVLELGGRDAMVVLADAEVRRAASGALWAATAGAGQARGSLKRVYAAAEIHDELLALLQAGAEAMRVGDPAQEHVQVGPLASEQRLAQVQALVAEALGEGAQLLCGGALQSPPTGCCGAFYAPAVIVGADEQARLVREGARGPVLAVSRVSSTEEALARANSGGPGLGASVWTADRRVGLAIARELRAGMVWCNDHLPAPMVSSGPWGSSAGGSLGRSFGEAGLAACAQEKLITWDPPRPRGLWWGPYSARMERAALSAARLRSARAGDRHRGLREGASALASIGARAITRR